MKLYDIVSDGMVLQSGKPVRVFGEGKGKVNVSFCGKVSELQSDGGKWCLDLGSFPYGGPYEMNVSLDGQVKTIGDIWIGEVVLCSGQSNMEMALASTDFPEESYEDDDLLRDFYCKYYEKGQPEPTNEWRKCAKESVGKWTAIGYFIGRELRKKLGCAVGIINCSRGASIIQSWIDKDIYIGSKLELPLELLYRDYRRGDVADCNEPGLLHSVMLEKVFPYSIAAMAWYQGESNTSVEEGKIYTELLGMLAENVRDEDMDSTLPLCVVQIPEWDACAVKGAWKLIQDAQMRAQEEVAYVKTVVSRDICESDDIHPKKKLELGVRMANAILELINKA